MQIKWNLNDVDFDLLEDLSKSPYIQENWTSEPLTPRKLKKFLERMVNRNRFTGSGDYDLGIRILSEKAEVEVTYLGWVKIVYSGEFYENFSGTEQTFYCEFESNLSDWKKSWYTLKIKGETIETDGLYAADDANREANEYLRFSRTASRKLTAKSLLRDVLKIKKQMR